MKYMVRPSKVRPSSTRSGKPHEKSTELRIMLVDDHAFMLQVMRLWLEQEQGISVAAQAGSLSEAHEVLQDESLAIDIVVVDLDLPDGSGTALISDLQGTRPQTPVLVLTAYSDPALLAQAIEAGAAGILHKSSPMRDILSALRRLQAGEQLLSQREIIEAVRFIGRKRLEEKEVRAKLDKLTPREREVLQALASGLGDKGIAQRLHVTPGTVRAHIVNILAKLEACSRLQALIFAVRCGAIKID